MKSVIKALLLIVLPICAAVLLVFASERLSRGQEGESLKQLESSVKKAVMTCYATEGVYPPTVAYLEEHYGIQIDHERYGVFYEIFGENIMPQITVMQISADEELSDDDTSDDEEEDDGLLTLEELEDEEDE